MKASEGDRPLGSSLEEYRPNETLIIKKNELLNLKNYWENF